MISEDSTEVSLYLETLTTPGSQPWKITLFIDNNPIEFKIDTGADVSVIPAELFDNAHIRTTLSPPTKTLKGPNQKPLDVVGSFTCHLQKGDRRIEDRVYVVKDVSQPLLGRPAIERLGLLSRIESITTDSTGQEARIVSQYPDIFNGLGTLREEYRICLKDGAKPFAVSTPRRIALPLLPKVKDELSTMESLHVISKVDTPTDWCAPMVVVPKPNGKVRICVDLTKLNASVKRERHILPAVEDTLAQLRNAEVFTKLDANSGFWQVPLSQESSLLTTFITPFGRYCFHRLPFGISSAPEHFQKRMSRILEGTDGVVCMMDDILGFGVDQDEHDRRLRKVLQKLREAGVTLNREKCVFSVPSVKFIDQIVGRGGVRTDPGKVSAILEMKAPTNVGEVRRFLGLVNQQSKYIKELAEKTEPLRALLQQKSQWTWGIQQQAAFDTVKREITQTPVLALYDPNRDTTLSADASSFGLGAVLRQRQPDGNYKPVAYASRSLSETERRYAQIEKETLAVTWATERFQHFLLGKDFAIETDHKPLVPLLGTSSLNDLPPRIQRFRLRLLRFSFSIYHVPGKELVVADALSRQPMSSPDTVDQILQSEAETFRSTFMQSLPASDKRLQEIKTLQDADAVISRVKTYVSSEWPQTHLVQGEIRNYWQLRNELHVQTGLLLRGSRIVIPPDLRRQVLDKLHCSHQGVTKCREKAKQAVWWPGISSQIEAFIYNCVTCARETKNPAEPLIYTPFPTYPWQKVAMDLFEWKGRSYLLVIDYYSRFVEIALLSSTTSPAVVNRIKSIFARYGIPESVMSDNGPQFASEAFQQFAREYQFLHVTSSPGFPQANGEAERAVQTIKFLLEKNDDPHMALLSYRATPLHNGYSPAELLMGRKLRTTVPIIPEQLKPKLPDLAALKDTEQRARNKMKQDHDTHHRVRSLSVLSPGTKVWVPDQRLYGTIVASPRPRSYLVETPFRQIRRNRRSVNPLPLGLSEETEEEENKGGVNKRPRQEVSPDPTEEEEEEEAVEPPPKSSVGQNDGSTITRSGRVSCPPQRLDL